MEFLTLAYRTVVMFTIILITMRVLGKRQLGQLELGDLVAAIMLSELAVSPITTPGHRLLHGIIPVLTLLLAQLSIAYLCMKNIRFRSLLIGAPSIIIRNGQIEQREMRKNRLTLTELTEALRTQGYTDISTIKYAILEVGGTMSVLPFAAHTPATHEAHNLNPEDKGLPILIINDGRVLDKNLEIVGLNRRWLTKELQKHGTTDPTQVFLLTVDEKQKVYYTAKS